ncbi:MAG: SAM-dependent methyltransferase, partial [Sulfurimonas sp.]
MSNLEIFESFAEDIKFDSNSFDVVYVRQAMHHANDLNKFIGECGRVVKNGGLLLTIRDHVIFDAKDKEWFLESHPLHKFYGGENAYKPEEYESAMENASMT